MPDKTDIQKLLRLKRYEQPPPGYYDDFLQEFQRRQRADMLRQSPWKLAVERFQALISEYSLGRMAYACGVAVVLVVAGVASKNILSEPNAASGGSAYAVSQPAAPQVGSLLALNPDVRLPQPAFSSQSAGRTRQASSSRPYYVIDARPVSYEPPSSF
jgi:hypothetical protein